jgi:hypothetical protein
MISTFDPSVYSNIMTSGNLSKFRHYELNRAVEESITKREIGE